MATNDDTSKPRRSRRNQPQTAAAPMDTAPLAATDLPPPEIPPRTLEEAIENVRTLMMQVRGASLLI